MGSSYGSHTLLKFRGTPVLITVGCGLPVLGYSLVADETVSGELYSVFAAKVLGDGCGHGGAWPDRVSDLAGVDLIGF